MDTHRLYQIQERYHALSAFHRAQVDRWIQDAKMTFYDHGRPYGTRLQPPSGIPRLSTRSMFELLYLAMDEDQIHSPPHTPPRTPTITMSSQRPLTERKSQTESVMSHLAANGTKRS